MGGNRDFPLYSEPGHDHSGNGASTAEPNGPDIHLAVEASLERVEVGAEKRFHTHFSNVSPLVQLLLISSYLSVVFG